MNPKVEMLRRQAPNLVRPTTTAVTILAACRDLSDGTFDGDGLAGLAVGGAPFSPMPVPEKETQ